MNNVTYPNLHFTSLHYYYYYYYYYYYELLINIDNANYASSVAPLYYELSVCTPLHTCDHRLTGINISRDS